MNTADRAFLKDHEKHIRSTLALVEKFDKTRKPGSIELMGLSTALMNIYAGMEVMMRHILHTRGIEISRSGSWHKDLLKKAVGENVISDEMRTGLKDYLELRHKHIHGYGYMDDWKTIKKLALNAKPTADVFFAELKNNGCI